MEIGPFIERARRRRGWTQAQLGRAIGVDQARVSRFEKNAGLPTIPQVLAMAEATGASLDELLRGADPEDDGGLTEAQRVAVDVVKALGLSKDEVYRHFYGDRAGRGPAGAPAAPRKPVEVDFDRASACQSRPG